MELSEEKILKAARIVANCPPKRLPIVLAILKQGGFDLNVDELASCYTPTSARTMNLKEKRVAAGDDWEDTANPYILELRKAFFDGVSFTALSNASKVHRVTLYNYLRGDQHPSPATGAKILKGLESLRDEAKFE